MMIWNVWWVFSIINNHVYTIFAECDVAPTHAQHAIWTFISTLMIYFVLIDYNFYDYIVLHTADKHFQMYFLTKLPAYFTERLFPYSGSSCLSILHILDLRTAASYGHLSTISKIFSLKLVCQLHKNLLIDTLSIFTVHYNMLAENWHAIRSNMTNIPGFQKLSMQLNF